MFIMIHIPRGSTITNDKETKSVKSVDALDRSGIISTDDWWVKKLEIKPAHLIIHLSDNVTGIKIDIDGHFKPMGINVGS